MKKLLTLSICALLGLSAMAQQLPNAGFEEAWVDCKPWTSKGNENTIGKTPTSWTIAQVIGMGSGTGKTQVGENAPGCESESAVKIYNSPNSTVPSQIVPGYVTLGTTWSTSVMGKKNDGGTFDGIDFSFRPDAVMFDYLRSHGADNAEEQASVVAYIWKGTYTQKGVPGNIVAFGNPTNVDMINRDRNILDMTTSQGGAVSKSEGAELIAKIDYALTGDAAEWTNKIIEFEYLTASTPEMFNIIFSAGNYWSTTPGKDNSLTIDNVKLLYYSRLNSLTVGEQEVALEDGKYEYTFDFVMPENIEYTLKGQSAKATVVRNEENHTATINVINVDADTDGKIEHNYVLSFAAPETYAGSVAIELEGAAMVQPANIEIYETGVDVVTFKLPNFALGEGEDATLFGDIVVENVTVSERDGLKYYEGTKTGLELLGGDIIADVTLAGTIDAEGNADMLIDVMWDGIPIYVDFFTKEREPETFGGFIGHKASADGAITNEYDGTMSLTCVSRNIYKFEMTGVDLDALSRATGNIVVENVLVTKDDKGNRTFAGESDNANAKVEGTIDAAKKATVKVEYKESADAEPKYIEFNTNKVQTGVDEIEAAGNGEVEYYNLQGIRVANPESGIYIRRQGSKVSKVYVK